MDFDDLIALPAKMLDEPELRARWRARLRYFLVDEYQDTSAAQYRLLRRLSGEAGTFTAVGDDDQSIYGWRGARPENLDQLGVDYPRLNVIKLEQNYRSVGTILKAANAVIAVNPHTHEKRLWSEHGPGDRIAVREYADEVEEAEGIARSLMDSHGVLVDALGPGRGAVPLEFPGARDREGAARIRHSVSRLGRPELVRRARDPRRSELSEAAVQPGGQSVVHARGQHAQARRRLEFNGAPDGLRPRRRPEPVRGRRRQPVPARTARARRARPARFHQHADRIQRPPQREDPHEAGALYRELLEPTSTTANGWTSRPTSRNRHAGDARAWTTWSAGSSGWRRTRAHPTNSLRA